MTFLSQNPAAEVKPEATPPAAALLQAEPLNIKDPARAGLPSLASQVADLPNELVKGEEK